MKSFNRKQFLGTFRRESGKGFPEGGIRSGFGHYYRECKIAVVSLSTSLRGGRGAGL